MSEVSNIVSPGATSPANKASNEQQRPLLPSPSASSDGLKRPKSGKLVVEWYLSLFSALSTMGTLGAGFTLSVVVLSPPDPDNLRFKRFTGQTVNMFGAISSILFVLTVLVSHGCAQLFRFERDSIAEGFDEKEPWITWSGAGLSLILQVQVLGAFVFLQLVLTAYQPIVGWVGIAVTGVLGLVALVLWVLQAANKKPVAK